MNKYETVIGLEVHVELSTKSKIFCSCPVDFGKSPNTLCCPVCTGMPGSLPVMNEKVLEYAVLTGLATNCSITKNFKFDRKNYFYPDLPKAYQISQLYFPVCREGFVDISVPGTNDKKRIGIHEIHMEEDAGKLIHDPWEEKTLVDYNRCGVPLLEIVSSPDMRSAGEAIAYITKLKSILEYIGVSDCKMQEGSLRADINLSVRKAGEKELGTRTEMKNMNSLKAISKAIENESSRQIALLEENKIIIQETRRWDDNKDKSFSMRSKENANDYRYFPEPDLLPFSVSDSFISSVRKKLPELMDEKQERYKVEYSLPELDIEIITGNIKLAVIFEEMVKQGFDPKSISNIIMGDIMKALKDNEKEASDLEINPLAFGTAVKAYDKGRINRIALKQIVSELVKGPLDPEEYIKNNSLEQISDTKDIDENVAVVIKENPKAVEDYLQGKDKALSFLMGKVMQKMKGKAAPYIVKKSLISNLDKIT